MHSKEIIGRRIKEFRKNRKMSQEFLAEKLGIEPRQLSKLETGKHYPSFETMTKLLGILNLSFEDFMNNGHLQSAQELEQEILYMVHLLDNNQRQIMYKFLKAIIN